MLEPVSPSLEQSQWHESPQRPLHGLEVGEQQYVGDLNSGIETAAANVEIVVSLRLYEGTHHQLRKERNQEAASKDFPGFFRIQVVVAAERAILSLNSPQDDELLERAKRRLRRALADDPRARLGPLER